MTTGTKSVLFGVHQFLWHPWTVAQSWRLLYGRWPVWHEWIPIIVHDWGYWGCEKMDDEKGQEHPLFGAALAGSLVTVLHRWGTFLRHPIRCKIDEAFIYRKWMESLKLGTQARILALGHSRFYAKKHHIEVSMLFRADKLCTRFDPLRFYVFRARLSGEIFEYVARSPLGYVTPEYWASWYYHKVEESFA